MNKHIAIATFLSVLSACAGNVADNPEVALQDPALGPLDSEPGDGVVVQEPGHRTEPSIALAMSAHDAISEEAIADIGICRFGFELPRGYAMGGTHAPAFRGVDDAMQCSEADDDGSVVTDVIEHTELLLAAYAPGYPFYVTHMTSGQDDSSAELSLLSDADLDRLHDELEVERELYASAIVVDTPVAGLRVSLSPVGSERELSPDSYLDAKGQRVDEAVDGGKALFVNIEQSVYQVRLDHDYVRCSPAGSFGWDMPEGTMVWALRGLEAYVGGIACQM